MALLTPTQLRAHVESGLSNAALQQIIDAEEAAINARWGSPGEIVEQRLGDGLPAITLGQGAAEIVSVTEDDLAIPPEGEEAGDHYRLANPYLLERCGGYWGDRITVTYTPLSSETARRMLVLIDLCKLQLAYSGYSSQGGADISESPLDLPIERERLLRQLRPSHWVFA